MAGFLAVLPPTTGLGQEAAVGPQGVEPSAERARQLSMIGALLPVAITVSAGAAGNGPGALAGVLLMIPGPSLGYYYGGRTLRGLASSGVRAGALLAMPAAIAICWDSCEEQRGAIAGTLALSGIGLFLGSIIYDVTHVAEDLRRESARESGTRIVPIVDPIDRRAGLAVSFPF